MKTKLRSIKKIWATKKDIQITINNKKSQYFYTFYSTNADTETIPINKIENKPMSIV